MSLPQKHICPSFYYVFDNNDPTDELYRYVTIFDIDIKAHHYDFSQEDEEEKIVIAGKARFSIIHGGAALNNNISIFEVMDLENSVVSNYGSVYENEQYSFVEPLNEYYNDTIEGLDLGIIERMEILPEYRGLGFGKLLIQDLYHRFGSVGLFVLKVFPLQLESDIEDKNRRSEWQNNTEYDNLETDYEKAHYTLLAYYQKLGFSTIPAFIKNHEEDDTLIFLNPSMKNKALDYK